MPRSEYFTKPLYYNKSYMEILKKAEELALKSKHKSFSKWVRELIEKEVKRANGGK